MKKFVLYDQLEYNDVYYKRISNFIKYIIIYMYI